METSVNNKYRAFTSLEQSKKLAEILPLESADNVIVLFGSSVGTKIVVMSKESLDVIRTPFSDIRETTMCWSLAALLDILQYPTLFQNGDKEWGCTVWIDTTKPYSISPKDNPIDACYEMIIKLHELNLL